MKTKKEVLNLVPILYDEIFELMSAGQKEYSGGEDALGNFNRLSKQLNISPEQILWVFLTKHLDGILSHINGHTSQREPVKGRINDAIVYLILLRAMVEDKNENSR